ncbi:MAG: 6-carboxytetrahydropterin synthase [Pirellulales bacterium]
MSERYWIRVSKSQHTFSAGHFITYDGDVCERLHGHNYRVAAEVHGPLDNNHYVVDFISLRDELAAIVLELDHHMLLPTEHPLIKVADDDERVVVSFQERRWEFPRCDCVLLPVANTTSELLARHIGLRLLDALERRAGARPGRIRIDVDECDGQMACCELVDE